MKLFVGVTDAGWFDFLAKQSPGEVNFWRPSGGVFRALAVGEPFLFKLHAPQNCIVGGGFFLRFSQLPVSLAWMAFEERNGTGSRSELQSKIARYRSRMGRTAEFDPVIGNIVLTEPFFWPRERWIEPPPNWPANTVQGKGYSTHDAVGARLWEEVKARLHAEPRYQELTADNGTPVERVRRWTLDRMHQGAFRVAVTEAYERQCAVTREHTLPVLEAAHIQPVAADGSHSVSNGILLRADLHILFDRGYVTFDEDYRLVVSERLQAEWHNGKEYYARRGERIKLPAERADWPLPERLAAHRTGVFVA